LLWHFNLQKGNHQSENSREQLITKRRWSCLFFCIVETPEQSNTRTSQRLLPLLTPLTCSVYTSHQTSCSSDRPDMSGTATTWWKIFTQNPQLLKPSILFCSIYCGFKVYFTFVSR
jgi:hypothetical protein